MIELIKGSKRLIPMEVTRRSSDDFEIASVDCKVLNVAGTEVESGAGTFSGSEIYYFLDTDTADYQVGRIYTVCFEVTIDGLPKVIKGSRKVKIVAC